MGAATAPAEFGGRLLQQAAGGLAQACLLVDGLTLQLGVAAALAGQGAFACGEAACCNGLGAFAGWGVQQVLRTQAGHFDVQVDPVEQRAAEFALVAADLIR